MKRIKVRGIYSTALCKFLLDEGFQIVQPSEKQISRFGIQEEDFPIDASINDFNEGIKIQGPAAEEIAKKIEENFDCFVLHDFVGRIYMGKIVGEIPFSSLNFIVKFGNYLGYLNEPVKSDEVLVQIKKYENGIFFLTQDIRLFGKYITLIKDGKTSFHDSFPEEEKQKFSDISVEGYGIYFTQFAMGRSKEEILEDINNLLKIQEKLDESEKIFFKNSFIVFFTKEGREKLDKIRDNVIPTARKHHLIRILGVDGSLDIIENIDKNRIDVLENNLLEERKVQVTHSRLLGKGFSREEVLLEKGENYIRSFREMKGGGYYDGLMVRKMPGDYAIQEYKEGEIWYRIEYFRKDGTKIGEYYNFNTPIEIFSNRVYYIDLEVDLIRVNNEWRLVDVDHFETLLEECPKLEHYKKLLKEKIKEITGGEVEWS